MENWTELKTAYEVARRGTVSAASKALGVHRATVNRRIDALERRLGAKLFQRHAKGYELTDVGLDLRRVVEMVEAQFDDLETRTRGRRAQLTGEVIVTSIVEIADLLLPAIAAFHAEHPEAQVTVLSTEALARLEYGEAHVALRLGRRPTEPDYVVQPLGRVGFSVYGHERYLARRGAPVAPISADALAEHDFVGFAEGAPNPAFRRWIDATIPPERQIIKASAAAVVDEAVARGLALGVMPDYRARRTPGLRLILPGRPSWSAAVWLVTHVDLHRSPKVQAMLAAVKTATKPILSGADDAATALASAPAS